MAAAVGAGAVEAPALGYLVIALSALILVVVLRGLRFSWVNTIGYLLRGIENNLSFSVLHVHVDIGGWAGGANNFVLNYLDKAIAAGDGAVGYFMHGAATLALWGLREIEHFTAETLAWADFMQRVHLPRWVKWAIYAAVPPLIAVRLADYARTHVIPRATKVTRIIVKQAAAVAHTNLRPIEHDIAALRHRVGGLAATVGAIAGGLVWPRPLPLPSLPGVWRGLTKRLARIERRLRRVESLLGAAGLAVAMANVLGLKNPNCLRGGPLGKFARALCGLGSTVLNDILSLLVDALIIGDPCDTMKVLTRAAEFVVTPVADLADGLDQAFLRCGYDHATALNPPSLHLPPAQTSLTIGV